MYFIVSGFQVLISVTVNSIIFLDIMTGIPVEIQRFSSETSVKFWLHVAKSKKVVLCNDIDILWYGRYREYVTLNCRMADEIERNWREVIFA
jgi:hypothetical protein